MKRAIFWLSVGFILLVIMIINNADGSEFGTGYDTGFMNVVPSTYESVNVHSKYKDYDFLGIVTWRNWFDQERHKYPMGIYHNDDQSNLIYSFCNDDGCYSIMIEEMKSKFMIYEAVSG
jgi:hypothetical protein